jgi:hypothetical protein
VTPSCADARLRAAAACAIKVHYLSPTTMTGDVLFDSINWTIWTVVECNIAIIAASVPSIVPLIKKINGKVGKQPRPNVMRDFEKSLPHVPTVDPTKRRTLSMQQALLNDGQKELARKEKDEKIIAGAREVSEDEMDEEDISQMYAAATRTILKAPPPPQPDQLHQMRKLSEI